MPLDAAITQIKPDSLKLCCEITYDTLRSNHSASVPYNLNIPRAALGYSVGAFSDIKGSAEVFRQLLKLQDLFTDKSACAFL